MKRILLSIFAFVGFAFADPTPTAVIQPADDYDTLLDDAIAQVDEMQKNLDDAVEKSKETAKSLDQAKVDLTAANNKADDLQKEIVKETDLLNLTRQQLNEQIQQTADYKQKYDVAESKLIKWRLFAASIIGLVVLYVVLKFTTKLPI